MLKINNLKVSIKGSTSTKVMAGKQEILKGIDLMVKPGQLHVLMGPNGSGKSTLAQVIAGAPQFTIDPTSLKLRGASSSPITFNGEDITKLTPDKRAKLGIFLGFQHPVEVPGVSVFNVLRRAKQSISGPVSGSSHPTSSTKSNSKRNQQSLVGLRALDGTPSATATRSLSAFRQELLEYASSLRLSDDFLRRSLNEGFSGGEKKRSEILQMMALSPKLVILDEIDSGLDVDGLKLVSSAINQFRFNNPRSSVLLITHYARILKYLKPDFVHVMVEGKIVKSGRLSLAREIENKGYQAINF